MLYFDILLLSFPAVINEILLFISNSASIIARIILLVTILYAISVPSYDIKRKSLYLFCSYATVFFLTLILNKNYASRTAVTTMEVAVLVIAFALAFKAAHQTVVLFFWGFLVACARLMISTHYAIDILFSTLIASLIALFWYWGLLSSKHTEMHEL